MTDIATVTEGTKDYLLFLRAKVQGSWKRVGHSTTLTKLIKVVSSIGIPTTSWPPEMQAAYLNGWSLNNIQGVRKWLINVFSAVSVGSPKYF